MGPKIRLVTLVGLGLGLGCKSGQSNPEAAPAPSPSGSITGTVVAEGSNSSMSGVRVCAWKRAPMHKAVREEALAATCTNTDATGRYALALGPGVWSVVATTANHEPGEGEMVLRASKLDGVLDLSLAAGGQRYAGTLVDLDGEPVAGVEIVAWLRFDRLTKPSSITTTDANGHYALWSGHDATLHANAPGYARMVGEGEIQVLLPESVIRGRVVGTRGQPIAGARVAHIERFGPAFGFPTAATSTDAAGEFRLTQLMPGEFRLLVTSDDGVGLREDQYVGFGETIDDVTILLDHPVQRLRARVLEPGGEPAAGCMVLLSPKQDNIGAGSWVWTDEEGLLDLPVPAPKYYVEGLSCPGVIGTPPYEPIIVSSDVDSDDAEIPIISVARGRVLRGRLLDADGRPLAGLRLFASEPEFELGDDRVDRRRNRFMTGDDEATTDADGRFEFNGLAPRAYELSVLGWSGIGEPRRFQIAEAAVTELEFRLPATARIEIQASEARAGQEIQIKECDGRWGARAWIQHTETDAEGRAIVEHAPLGRHRVGIDAEPNCDEQRGTAIELERGQTLRLALSSAPTDPAHSPLLSVRVLTADGSPAANAVVEVDVLGFDPELATRVDWSSIPSDSLAITDADGRVEAKVRSSQPGPWPVVAVRPGQFASGLLERGGGELTLRLQPTTSSNQ